MEGAKKNQDKLNMVGIVVVGICGAVLVYVSIVLLEAFYMNDSSEVTTMADYGGQDTAVKSIKAAQQSNINTYARGPAPTGGGEQMFHISIDRAMSLVADEAKVDPSNLVPGVGKSEKTSIKPVFGRPQLGAAAGSAAAGSGSAAPAAGSGSATPAAGSGSDAGSAAGSAAPAAGSGSAAGSAAPAAGSGSAAPAAGSGSAAPAAGSGSAAPAAGSGAGSAAPAAPGGNGH
jgi:hypothetical protein